MTLGDKVNLKFSNVDTNTDNYGKIIDQWHDMSLVEWHWGQQEWLPTILLEIFKNEDQSVQSRD